MQIKELILKLQTLYSTYDEDYKSVMGEPEIYIDIFSRHKDQRFDYVGISPDIVIEKTDDGVYDVFCAFDPEGEKKVKFVEEKMVWPFPNE